MLACSAFIAYAKTKTQISFAVTAKLISAFVFATWIVQSLFFLNPGLCGTWSEPPKTGFLTTRLILYKDFEICYLGSLMWLWSFCEKTWK